ncbi:unnamed protein product [Caenorhabditis angaria]|uniref:Uncharacterized protein n=1 Tax=Caenorhabditis angaria TaxID=860376 RepID=A0A9P1J1W5_9PELO|nr:unnamed protein product [Caenorhabditis angaria]
MAQYDDISILGEVLERSTGQPEGSGVEETTIEAVSSTEVPSTTTTEEVTEPPTTTEVTETTTEVTSTATEESTTEAPTTTEAVTTTTTEILLVPETSAPEEDIDEDSFLGFKKPDLATIYRRLFPFQHTPQRDFKL